MSTDARPGAGPATLEVVGPALPDSGRILTPEAIEFLTQLHVRFAQERINRLDARARRRDEFASGVNPDFLAETKHIRDDKSWKVAGPGPANAAAYCPRRGGDRLAVHGHQRLLVGALRHGGEANCGASTRRSFWVAGRHQRRLPAANDCRAAGITILA